MYIVSTLIHTAVHVCMYCFDLAVFQGFTVYTFPVGYWATRGAACTSCEALWSPLA